LLIPLSGQKRKRNAKAPEADRKKQETERSGAGAGKGYLAEYGEYKTPPRQTKKQKDVVVPSIPDVRTCVTRCDMCEPGLIDANSARNLTKRSTMKTGTTLCKKIASSVSGTA
jgi:hypothetical protein